MELELILTELQPFKLSHFGSCFLFWQLFFFFALSGVYSTVTTPIVFEGFFSYFVDMLGA